MESEQFLPDYLEKALDGLNLPSSAIAKHNEIQLKAIEVVEDQFIQKLRRRGELPRFNSTLELKSYRDAVISQSCISLPSFYFSYGSSPSIIKECLNNGSLPYRVIPAPHKIGAFRKGGERFYVYIDEKRLEQSSYFAKWEQFRRIKKEEKARRKEKRYKKISEIISFICNKEKISFRDFVSRANGAKSEIEILHSKIMFFERKIEESQNEIVLIKKEESRLRERLAEGEHMISTLEEQLAESRARTAELEAAATEPTTTARTQAATESRQEKALREWQAAFKVMIPVILQCHAEEPKKRTKEEFQAMCSRHGGRLTDTQLDFLRDCLPAEHVNRNGGPSIQKGTPFR